MNDLLFFLAGLAALAAGFLAGWAMAARTAGQRLDEARSAAEARAALVRAGLEERIRGLEAHLDELRSARDRDRGRAEELSREDSQKLARIRELETRLADRDRNYEENLQRLNGLVAEANKSLANQFEAVAGKILEEKTAKFTETNRSRLDELLGPLRERLQEFQKKVEDTHLREMQGQSALKAQLENLQKLNQQVSEDAKSLASALKGETKTQGTWGELILERALELCGLERGREYEVQDSRTTEDGRRQQPDVVIRLPEGRHLIIDSKVSLVAYERACNTEDDDARERALNEHLLSLRNHVRSLGEKNYPAAYGVDSVDFVLLFVPVEPALLAALRADPALYEAALARNVVLVSPANLLATLRVVKHIWQIERQSRNHEEIARLGGLLYDGFVGFVGEILKVQRHINQASDAVNATLGKLRDNGGHNLVRRAERLKELGVKTQKSMPREVAADSDDEEAEETSPALPDQVKTG